MNILNNREIAVGIWIVILIIWSLTHPSIRKSLFHVLRALTKRVILVSLGLMATYVGLLVYCLYELELWTTAQLKNTIILSGSVAVVSLFRISDIADEPHYFRTAIKDILKLVTVLEFIVAFYAFSLWIELLIVPLSTLVAGMLAIAQTDKKYEHVEKLLNGLLMWFGMGLIFYAAFKLFSDFGLFAKPQTLTDFYLPPTLSLFYLPFLFVVALYVNYETAFIRLQFAIKKPALRTYAKRCAIIAFHFRIELLKRWIRNLMLTKPVNKQDVKNTICEIKVLWARELSPEEINLDRGWSPYVAREFLTTEGLVPDDYHRSGGNCEDWCASSTYLEIGDEIIPNNIAYLIEGNETVATMLKLIMNVSIPDISREANQKFCNIAQILFAKALDNEMPEGIKRNLSNETEMTTHLNEKEIIILKELWPSHHMQGYTIKFIIQNNKISENHAVY